jgi:hypothetical protein
MNDIEEAALTAQQKKWMAAIRANLEKDTGRALAEWVAIAKTCPETAHRARLRWFKSEHGLLQNRASYVLGEAFPSTMTWREPEALRAHLWKDASGLEILAAVESIAAGLDGVVQGQRKGFTAWSRRAQFAALRPRKEGGAMLGLAVCVARDGRLQAPKNESWSERLKSRIPVDTAGEIKGLGELFIEAWRSS